jgi:hypothetical protein
MKKLEVITIGDITLANFPIEMLTVDKYQRKPKNMSKLRNNFNKLLRDPIKVSLRNGEYNVVDGWHSVTVAKENGKTHIVGQLFTDLDLKTECKLFSTQTDAVVKIGCEDKFNADLVAEDEYAINLQNMLDKYNLTFFSTRGRRKAAAPVRIAGKNVIISEAQTNEDCKAIEFVFSLLKEINWSSEPKTICFASWILRGLLYAYHTYHAQTHNLSGILVKELGQYSSTSFKEYFVKKYPALDYDTYIKKEMDSYIRTK